LRSVADDQRLVEACRSSDRSAAETLVRRHSDTVYRAVQGTLLSRQVDFSSQDLEDLHNTVFLKLFERGCRKLAQFEGRNGCSFKTWIRVVTVRSVLNDLRDRNPHGLGSQHRRMPIETLTALISQDPDPEARLQAAQKRLLLDQGLAQCNPVDRLFFKLHFENDLALPEVADILGISVESTYTRKHRLVKRLKASIEALQRVKS
jgi:RNA polymerase sigma-70 factor, ECF subfamily